MDIKAKASFPANKLSNFEPYDFVFHGVPCASMEGLVQSFKIPDSEIQKKACSLTGKTAKEFGRSYDHLWKSTQLLWWKGVPYPRESPEYQLMLFSAFNALASNDRFQRILLYTGTRSLTHSIGSRDPKQTVLTEDEFCGQLLRLRARLVAELQ